MNFPSKLSTALLSAALRWRRGCAGDVAALATWLRSVAHVPPCPALCPLPSVVAAMDTDKIKIYGARVRVDSMAKVADIEAAEKEKMREKCEKIVGHGISCFVNRQLIYNYPEQVRGGRAWEEPAAGRGLLLGGACCWAGGAPAAIECWVGG